MRIRYPVKDRLWLIHERYMTICERLYDVAACDMKEQG